MSYNKKAIADALAKLNKTRKPKQVNDIIMDPEGQNKFPGLPTRIPSDSITMETTPYPVLGVDNFGNQQMMYPGANYTFPGAEYVDEYPIIKIGGATDWKSRIASTLNYQQGGLFHETYLKAKQAQQRDPKKFAEETKKLQMQKSRSQAREYYQNKYNQQPVVQLQPSETVNQSRGLDTRREKEIVEAQANRDAKAAENYMHFYNKTYGSDYGAISYEQALQKVKQPNFDKEKFLNMYNLGQPKNEQLQSFKEEDQANRIWEVITNPFTAFEYAVATGDMANMPSNINAARMQGYDVGVTPGRNMVGNALNMTTNLFDAGDKVVRNIGEGNYGTAALEAMRFLPGARVQTGLGSKAGKYLTTQTPLKNAYKINPWAFKPNPDFYYRMGEGRKFLDDVLETNKIRAYNENSYANLREAGKISGIREDGKIVLKAKTFPEADTYWSKGVPLDGRYASQKYGDYMIEASNDIPFIHAVNQKTKQRGFWDAPDVNYNATHTTGNYVKPRQSYGYDIEGNIKPSIGTPLEYNPDLIKLYKPHWLRGYKPIEVPRQLPGSPNAISSVSNVGRGLNQADIFKNSHSVINNIGKKANNISKVLSDYAIGFLESIKDSRPFFEKFPITKKQLAKANLKQDQALKEALDFVKLWHYGKDGNLRPEIVEMMQKIDPDFAPNFSTKLFSDLNVFNNANNMLVSSRSKALKNSNLTEEAKNYIKDRRSHIGGVNFGSTGESVTLRNHGFYSIPPDRIKDVVIHEAGHTAQKLGNNPYFDYVFDQIAIYDPTITGYTMANPNTKIGQFFKEIMVEPKLHKKDAAGNIIEKGYTWEASPKEIHSELLPARAKLLERGLKEGYTQEEVLKMLRNPNDKVADALIKTGNLNRFFKPTTSAEDKRKAIRMLYSMLPLGLATGAGSQYQQGGTTEEELTPAQLAMMKARLAYAHMHGNPSAQRMVAPVDNPYIFTGNEPYASPDAAGYSGTHYMFSQGPFAVPTIQTGPDGQLYYNVNASPNDSEAMQFDSPEDAEVFARYYKTVAPAFQDMELTDEEIEEYKRGGCTIVKL